MNLDIHQRVCDAIASVDDPCSIRANAPLSIFELGLVRDWSVDDDGDVRVVLSPTAPSCVLMGSIIDGVQRRLRAVAGVRSVDVRIDTDTFWTPALMSHEGRAKLGARRAGSMDRVPVKPRQWKQAVIEA